MRSLVVHVAFVAVVLVLGCHEPWAWHGLPHPENATCAWDNDISFGTETCIDDGHAYVCIRNSKTHTVECAPKSWPRE